MPRDLFGNVTDPSIKLGSRKWYTVPLSLAAHSIALVGAIVVPLMATGALPSPTSGTVFVPVVATPLPAPPSVRRAEIDRMPNVNHDAAPLEAPPTIEREASIDEGFETGVPGGTGLDQLGVVEDVNALPPPPAPPSTQPTKVHVGGDIKAPEKIRDAAPIYPTFAQIAKIDGVVILEATINVDGHVQDVRVLRSRSPLLDDAAVAAVRQWIYTPTRLNGQPVSVVMTVTVHFKLH